MLKITLKKSVYGNTPTNRRTVTALGLGKRGRSVYQKDTPSVRGMIRSVQHLLEVEVVDAAPEKAKKAKKSVVVSAPEKKEKSAAESEPKAAAKPKAPAKPKAATATKKKEK